MRVIKAMVICVIFIVKALFLLSHFKFYGKPYSLNEVALIYETNLYASKYKFIVQKL